MPSWIAKAIRLCSLSLRMHFRLAGVDLGYAARGILGLRGWLIIFSKLAERQDARSVN